MCRLLCVLMTLRVTFDLPSGGSASIKADGISTRATEKLPAHLRD